MIHLQKGNEDDVETYELRPTKAGIVKLLNQIASYPDNG